MSRLELFEKVWRGCVPGFSLDEACRIAKELGVTQAIEMARSVATPGSQGHSSGSMVSGHGRVVCCTDLPGLSTPSPCHRLHAHHPLITNQNLDELPTNAPYLPLTAFAQLRGRLGERTIILRMARIDPARDENVHAKRGSPWSSRWNGGSNGRARCELHGIIIRCDFLECYQEAVNARHLSSFAGESTGAREFRHCRIFGWTTSQSGRTW